MHFNIVNSIFRTYISISLIPYDSIDERICPNQFPDSNVITESGILKVPEQEREDKDIERHAAILLSCREQLARELAAASENHKTVNKQANR